MTTPWEHYSALGWPPYSALYRNVPWSYPYPQPDYYPYVPAGGLPMGLHYPAYPSAATGYRRPIRHDRPDNATVITHPLLERWSGSTLVWDITQSPQTAQRHTSRNRLEPVPASVLAQVATHPPARDMRIVCDSIPAFPCDIIIHVPRRTADTITVGMVLESIHKELHVPLAENEWEAKNSAMKKTNHIAMCERLKAAAPSIHTNVDILRVDCLSGKTTFKGLTQIGASQEEWALSLGSPVDRE